MGIHPTNIRNWQSLIVYAFGRGPKIAWNMNHTSVNVLTNGLYYEYGLWEKGVVVKEVTQLPPMMLVNNDIYAVAKALDRIGQVINIPDIKYYYRAAVRARLHLPLEYPYFTCSSFAYFVATGQYDPWVGTRQLVERLPEYGYELVVSDMGYGKTVSKARTVPRLWQP